MSDSSRLSDAGAPGAVYVTSKDAPRDLRRVVHLHRRAGFAAAWEEL
jgi:hypothetical protein